MLRTTACLAVLWRYATAVLNDMDCTSWKADAYRWQEAAGLTIPYVDAGIDEKHSPFIVLNSTHAKVVVGKGAVTGDPNDLVHPMVDDPDVIHFIQLIWVEDQSGNLVSMRHLSPAEPAPATMYFEIPTGTTSLRAFELCNLHGLYRSPAVSVASGQTSASAPAACSVQQCSEGTSVSNCQAFAGELMRREDYQPKTDPTGKHTPFLVVNGTTATIVVGVGGTPGNEGGLVHPMTPSDDKDFAHWISHIYAVDDLGNLVAMCELLPTDPVPASCTFQVPENIPFLRPYEFCNVHGLYIGDLVQVSNANASAERNCIKRECTASQPSLGAEPLRSKAVDALLQQQQDTANRISSINMCLQHKALYYVAKSVIDEDLQADIDRLTEEGDAESDIARRIDTFPELFAKLNALGGRWAARDVVVEHTLQDANGTQPSLRLDLINEAETRFKQTVLGRGNETFAEGINQPIVDYSEDLLIIDATFGMDWGYTTYRALGPHYTIFYSLDFVQHYVNVSLCCKTLGWMGMGWLDPAREGGPLMQDTDMVVAYVKDGQAGIEDRFARWIEEPLKDELLQGQRSDDLGNPLNGANDLELVPGVLGTSGKEWCPDDACNPGFSLVQFRRKFMTEDVSDIVLPVKASKIGIIFSFAKTDPFETYLEQHLPTSTGYIDIAWNLVCDPGLYFDITVTECKPCEKGFLRPDNTSVFTCLRAPPGTFQNETGQASAKPCKRGFTTFTAGATQEFACVCPGPSLTVPSGRYHVDICGGTPRTDARGALRACAQLGDCVECPEGMICEGARDVANASDSAVGERIAAFCSSYAFADTEACTSRVYCEANLEDTACDHAPPKLLPGYWSSPDDPLSVYTCASEFHCRGGPPGEVCASGRRDVACGLCKANYHGGDQGTCIPCESTDMVPGILALTACVLVAIAVSIRMRSHLTKNSKAVLSLGIILSQAGVLVQTLGVFSDLTMVWEEPVKTLLELMQLVNLDLSILRIQCMVGNEDPALSVMMILLTLPGLCILGGLMGWMLSRYKGESFSWPRYLNVVGLLVMFGYLAVCMALSRPIHCVSNPNGTQSMKSFPAQVCWTDSHTPAAIEAIFGLTVFGLGFLAYIMQVVWRYPSLVDTGHGLKLLTQYHFLFNRFGSHAYYWGPYFILQKLLVAIVPIVFADSAIVQIMLLSLLMVIYLATCCHVKPWATDLANLADVFLNMGLMLMLLIAAFLADSAGRDSRSRLSVILVIMLLKICFGIASLAGYAVYKKLFPGKMYDYFLCHHKAGAGTLCRWLKTEMLKQSKNRAKVFLDSDELEGLADIGDIVKSQTGTLVIVATKSVLSRPWCAVEITSGVNNKIDIVMVECNNFSHYDEEGFRALREGWGSADIMIFAQNAIDPGVVEECYRRLQSVTRIPFDSNGTLRKHQEAVATLLKQNLPKTNEEADKHADVVILGAVSSSEGKFTCQVLADNVIHRTAKNAVLVCSSEDAVQASATAQYMLVVLSGGILQDDTFLAMLEAVDTAFTDQLEIVSAIADQNFEFPSANYFQALVEKGSKNLEQSVRRVVNILALPFSPQVSSKVLSAQADELCRRFRFKDETVRRTSLQQQHPVVPHVRQDAHKKEEAPEAPATTLMKDAYGIVVSDQVLTMNM